MLFLLFVLNLQEQLYLCEQLVGQCYLGGFLVSGHRVPQDAAVPRLLVPGEPAGHFEGRGSVLLTGVPSLLL